MFWRKDAVVIWFVLEAEIRERIKVCVFFGSFRTRRTRDCLFQTSLNVSNGGLHNFTEFGKIAGFFLSEVLLFSGGM